MLKFAFDKFSDIVYGYPVKVRTDCQALWYVLMNDKLSAMHARWQDSVLAHNIINVQHVPGVTNIADDSATSMKTPQDRTGTVVHGL